MSLKSRDCIDSEALVLVRHRDGDPHRGGGGGGEGGRLLEDGALQDKARVRTLDRTLPLTHADQAPVLPSQGWGQFHLHDRLATIGDGDQALAHRQLLHCFGEAHLR